MQATDIRDQIRLRQHVLNHLCQTDQAHPAIQPMPPGPVTAIAPDPGALREGRPGPGVPAPRTHRLYGRFGRSPCQRGLQHVSLDEVVTLPVRIGRQGTLITFQVKEPVGGIPAPIHRGTPQFGQTDRFASGHPGGGGRRPLPPCSGEVGAGPPARQVLGPEHPVLAMGAVMDRGPDLRLPVRAAGIIPVIGLTTDHPGPQIVRVSGPLKARQGIEMLIPVTPVGQWRIPVHRDEIDVRAGPERIQREQKIGSAGRRPGSILRPVGGVRQLDTGAQNGPHLRGQLFQRLDKRKAARLVPEPCQADQLRSDEERLKSPEGGPKARIMQDKVTIAECSIVSHKGRNVGPDRRLSIRCGGQPPTPGKGGLQPAALRRRSRASRRNVHQQEGRQRWCQTCPDHCLQTLQNRLVCRGAPIIRPSLILRHQIGLRPVLTRHTPRIGHGVALARLDPGPDPDLPGAQIVAKPGHL